MHYAACMDAKWGAEAWRLLADEIRSARDARGLTQNALAQEAGISIRTLQDLEAGIPRGRMPRLMPRVERALGWRPGSARSILDGGVPALAESARPLQLSIREKEKFQRFLESQQLPPNVKRALIADLQAIPEPTE